MYICNRFNEGGSEAGMLRFAGVRQGWMLGRLQDLSDIQWRSFRSGMPILAAFFASFCLLNVSMKQLVKYEQRIHVLAMVCVLFLFVVHGPRTVFLLALMMCFFVVSRFFAGKKLCSLWIWTFACLSLVLARLNNGFSLGLFGLNSLDNTLESAQWHITYNLVVLRLISFGMDMHWNKLSLTGKEGKMQCHLDAPRLLPERRYRAGMFLLYVAYPPLYLTGPIISYDDFADQFLANDRKGNLSIRFVTLYGIRLAFAFLLLEAMTHFFYFNAIAKSGAWKPLYANFGPKEIGLAGFWTLFFMWMKFLCIWRFARFWALMDGINTVENMRHCLVNNYDIESFWKSWHASYNRWLVRYMYVPLGGRTWRVVNVWPIFTFVALWHDLEVRLLGWAWIICLFILPEVLVKHWAQHSANSKLKHRWWFSVARGFLSSMYISVLMAANLAGFVLGVDGLRHFMRSLFTKDGIPFLLGSYATFYVASQFAYLSRNHRINRPDASSKAVLSRSIT